MFSQAHRNKISCLFNTTSLLLLNLKERISWRPSPPWRHHREWKVKTFQHLCSRAFSSCKQKLSSHEDRVFLCVSVCIWVCERCQEDLYTAAGLPPSDQDHPDFNTQSRGRGAATHTHTITHYANVAMELLSQRHTLHLTKTNCLWWMLHSCSAQPVRWKRHFQSVCECIMVMFVCTMSKYIRWELQEEIKSWKVSWKLQP